MIRKYGFVYALLLGAACKGSDGVGPPVTTTVVVSSNPTQIAVNQTAQASAIVKDQNGAALTGKQIVWTSLNQGVATVSTDGLIKGISPGNATIQGAVDGVTGTAAVTVFAPAQSCLSGPTTVDIATGQVSVVSSADSKGCIKIASTTAASAYVVITANTNAIPDQLETFALKSDEGETIPAANLLASPYRMVAQMPLSEAEMPGQLQARFEANLRRMERQVLDIAGAQRAYAAAAATAGADEARLRMSVATSIPSVGDKTKFNIPKSPFCTSATEVTATARYISARAILYTDDASPEGGFTDADFQEIGSEFDNKIYPTDVDYFGTPLDRDENSRIIILYTPEVNKLTAENSGGGFVGGFFFVGDLFPKTGAAGEFCTKSNFAEIFYLLAPDPNGTINNNPRSTVSVRQGTRGTIAHEFQHMINGSERIRSPFLTEAEATWLDEALSHFAEDLNGRVSLGLSEQGNSSAAQLKASFDDYNAFFFQNLARFRLYLENPGPNSPTSQFSDTSLADRGAGWALLRYTADHYAPNGDIKAFIRSLVPGPDTGVVNLVNHAGNVPFNTLISGWMVANYADDAGISGLPVLYTYKTYNMRDAIAKYRSSTGQYPLKVTPVTGSGVSITGLKARSASGNYFSFTRPASGAARTFRFLNNDLSTAASFTGALLIVLRTQ